MLSDHDGWFFVILWAIRCWNEAANQVLFFSEQYLETGVELGTNVLSVVFFFA